MNETTDTVGGVGECISTEDINFDGAPVKLTNVKKLIPERFRQPRHQYVILDEAVRLVQSNEAGEKRRFSVV